VIKPLWAVTGVAVLGAAGVAGGVIVASPGGEEEAVQQVQTSSPTTSVTPGVSPTPSPTAVATAPPTTTPPTTSPTEPAIPPDWPNYPDPGGVFTVRYPSTWFQVEAQFFSSDPRAWPANSQPPDMIQVEVSYFEAAGSDTCGAAISTDPKSGRELGPLPGATATSLGGQPAWELVRLPGDPATQGDFTRIHGIATVRQGYCFLITAYYTQENPDVPTFRQIASSLQFNSQAG
jgi:hypothetical protein